MSATILVVLRRKLAAQIDSDPRIHVLPRLVREFRRIDAEIRALETAEALASEDQADPHPPSNGFENPWPGSSHLPLARHIRLSLSRALPSWAGRGLLGCDSSLPCLPVGSVGGWSLLTNSASDVSPRCQLGKRKINASPSPVNCVRPH